MRFSLHSEEYKQNRKVRVWLSVGIVAVIALAGYQQGWFALLLIPIGIAVLFRIRFLSWAEDFGEQFITELDIHEEGIEVHSTACTQRIPWADVDYVVFNADHSIKRHHYGIRYRGVDATGDPMLIIDDQPGLGDVFIQYCPDKLSLDGVRPLYPKQAAEAAEEVEPLDGDIIL